MTDFSTLDDGFGHWLAGFVDGEGCFYIRATKSGYVCAFAIGLRPDDFPIIQEIVTRVGIGAARVIYGEKTQQARWEVNRKADCAALVELFGRFPLRAKKRRDLEIWGEAVREWQKVKARRQQDWTVIAALKARLAERLTYVARRPD